MKRVLVSVAVIVMLAAALLWWVFRGISDHFAGTPALPPERVPGVPKQAVWSGGPDGGDWLLCRETQSRNRLSCEVYHDCTGELVARGEFALLPEASDSENGLDWREFRFFDGTTIFLPNRRRLVPDGWIEYPEARKKQKYELGREATPEQPL